MAYSYDTASERTVEIRWSDLGHASSKIWAIKELRNETGYGLREAKNLVEGGPFHITFQGAKRLVATGHFAYTGPVPGQADPGQTQGELDPNTLNDIRGLVFLARIGLGTIKPTLDSVTLQFMEEMIDRLTKY